MLTNVNAKRIHQRPGIQLLKPVIDLNRSYNFHILNRNFQPIQTASGTGVIATSRLLNTRLYRPTFAGFTEGRLMWNLGHDKPGELRQIFHKRPTLQHPHSLLAPAAITSLHDMSTFTTTGALHLPYAHSNGIGVHCGKWTSFYCNGRLLGNA